MPTLLIRIFGILRFNFCEDNHFFDTKSKKVNFFFNNITYW